MALTRQVMIDRMLASDADYDGRFLTGVTSTGIYCLPSCPARKPRPENVRFFRRPEEAEAAGLRACKRCRPLDFYRDHDPDRQRLEALADRLRREPESFAGVGDLAKASGFGSSKLCELMRRHYHTTPSEMLCRRRIERASRALLESDRPVADVAFEAGFETLSAFNESFRRLQRMSPGSYRRLARSDRFEIDLPAWFRAGRVLAYLGRDPASLTERVNGRAFAFGTRAGGALARVRVELAGETARCRVERPAGPGEGGASGVHGQVLRLLGLGVDPRPFERRASRQGEIARLVRGRPGLTVPQTPTVFDGLIWVIAGQQVSLGVAFALRRRLTRRLGEALGDGLYAPPSSESVAELTTADLRDLSFSQRKAEYLLGVARAVVEGAFEADGLADLSATAIERRLLAIRGLGPWSAHYLMMRSLGLVDCVPVGDAALGRNLKSFFELPSRPDARATRRLMAPFAPHRSLATFHLWSLKERAQ